MDDRPQPFQLALVFAAHDLFDKGPEHVYLPLDVMANSL
jgi:hypothetical protein